ncbi:hypothetical protein SO802_012942 [Lithocarpus litseifolius]|uniref:RNase H type-1 domain-containing protein n=1 Tax=Lithocarpus litseifolius TaxID=425828 RepID=A0AAW2D4X1_9ROSI
MAEFWALCDGLTLAYQMGLPCLEVELDAEIVVDLVLSRSMTNIDYSSLLNDCGYLNKFQQLKVNHIFREAYRCADILAKRGCSQQEDFVVLLSPPSPEFVSFVCMDAAGLYLLRRSASTLPLVAI